MKKQSLLNLLNSLVTPAFGCTEIGCIAYASSTAAEYLSNDLKEMLVYVSPFIYRNVANVGVPELGKVGVDGIAAAGYVVKKPEKKLMVLNGITKSQIQQTHKLLKNELVKFFILKKCDPVYTKVIAKDIKGNICEVLIEQKHDTIQHIKLNDCKIFVEKPAVIKDADETINVKDVSLTDIYNGIQMLNRKDLHFFIRGINMNEDIAKVGDQKHYFKLKNKKTNWREHILFHVCNAISARMDGCPLPVMSSNDSGDHGITVNLPQYVYHLQKHTQPIVMLRAIALANLITWKIKKNIGSLSAYCGSVVAAATGTIVGIGYQRNYTLKQINDLINYCLCSYSGSLCDGAKLSCSWKVESALIIGFKVLKLVESKQCLPNGEGTVNKDAFQTIKLLGMLSQKIMNITNSKVIDIINFNRTN